MDHENQVGLVFLLIYACGALVELMIRMSLGVPAWAKPAFEKHIMLVALQPVIFMLLPALLWPLMVTYRLLRPVYDFVAARCCSCYRSRASANRPTTTDDAHAPRTTTANGGIPLTPSRPSMASSMASTIPDLEKQDLQLETSPGPSAGRTPRTTTTTTTTWA